MSVLVNPVYQTAVTELEQVLSPRIVSRALKDGLRQLGRSPDTADLSDIEKVMKSHVYRQLQVLMPVTQAKDTVAGILERLAASAAGASTPAEGGGLEAQGERLSVLQSELKPFNLYFEWPEVQKLRAQVQFVESDHAAGREAPGLLGEAESQLAVVKQKLEDQLVLQARDLVVVKDALDQVRGSNDPRERRLETLVNQVVAAQEQRHLVQAELERAHRLARELLKAQAGREDGQQPPAAAAHDSPTERSGALEQPLAATRVDLADNTDDLGRTHDQSSEGDEAVGRVHRLDIDGELHDLRTLESDHANLLEYLPELGAHISELRAELEAERSVASVLSGMRTDLEASAVALRDDLREELEELSAALAGMRQDVGTSELDQALRVTLGILGTGLPNRSDVEHVRRLYQLVREQEEVLKREDEQRAAGLEEQAELIERLEMTLLNREGDEDVREEVERLRAEFDHLRLAHSQNAVAHELVSSARQAEEALARSLAARATEESERLLAQLTALRAKLERLPVTATVTDRAAALRSEVQRLLQAQENAAAVAGLLLDDVTAPPALDEAELEALGTEIEALRLELTSSLRSRLMRLAEEATELGNHPLIEHIQRALLGLELDRYPDLAQFQAALRQEREAHRQEQLDEFKRLSQDAAPFENLDSGAELKTLLADARARIEAGEPAQTLKRAAELVKDLEQQADARLAGLPARLDAALIALEPVSKLNSDGVTTVRRILYHLDSQRDALPRLSRGLQLQLEQALSQSERMLVDLRSEYEATRLVADQVVAGGLLDGVLGFFKSPTDERAPTTERSSFSRAAVLADYLAEKHVEAGAWTDAAGELLAGDAEVVAAGGGALTALGAAVAAVLPETSTACLQTDAAALVIAWLPNGERLVLQLAEPDLAGLMVNRVRRDATTWPLAAEPSRAFGV